MRIPMLDRQALDPELQAMLEKWEADGVRAHFTEEEALELSWAIAEFIALGKIIKVFDLPFGGPATTP